MQDNFKRTLILNSSIIFASFVIFSLVATFLYKQVDSKGARILEMRKSIARFSGSAERLSNLKNSSVAALEYEKKMEVFLPIQDQLFNFPEYARGIARDNQVEIIISFIPNSTVVAGAAAGNVGFTMEVKGTFLNVTEFMEQFEKKTTRFWVGLDSMEINRTGETFSLKSQGKVFFK